MEFNLVNFLSLGPLIIIGAISSYTDIKYNKIFNSLIIISLKYVIFLYLFLFIFFEDRFHAYILNLILNGLVAFSVSYLLWHFRLWSAGDAKLFTVYAFLIPLGFYSKSYIQYFPSFNLLINLFIPLLVIIVISAIMMFAREMFRIKEKVEKIRLFKIEKLASFFPKTLQLYLNYIFIFVILQSAIFPLTGNFQMKEIFSNPFFIFGLLILTISSFNKARQKKKQLNWVIYSVILIHFSFFIFFKKDLNQITIMLKTALVFMVFIGLTRSVLSSYIQKKETKKIKVKNIKEGMIPVDDEKFMHLKKDNDSFGKIDAGGLSRNQIKIISDFFEDNENSEIKIYKTIPFAPFLFLSAVISILTQSSFLPLVDKFFQKLI